MSAQSNHHNRPIYLLIANQRLRALSTHRNIRYYTGLQVVCKGRQIEGFLVGGLPQVLHGYFFDDVNDKPSFRFEERPWQHFPFGLIIWIRGALKIDSGRGPGRENIPQHLRLRMMSIQVRVDLLDYMWVEAVQNNVVHSVNSNEVRLVGSRVYLVNKS